MYSIHRTNENEEVTLYAYDGSNLRKLTSEDLEAFLYEGHDEVRTTAVNATDGLLLALKEAGTKISYAHWHSLNIPPKSTAEDIVKQVYTLPSEIFREFVPREDIAALKQLVIKRDLITQWHGDFTRQWKQAARNEGLTNKSPELKEGDWAHLSESGKKIESFFKTLSDDEKTVSLDTRIKKLASAIPECQIFAKLIGTDMGVWPTKVVTLSGGLSRFPSVSAWWHYCGENVVDGKAPERKTGQPIDWNPKLRTANFICLASCLRQKEKFEWYQYFTQAKEIEAAAHETKCPKCKSPKGHIQNRAMRRTRKEILKQFYLLCQALKPEVAIAA